MVIGKSNNPRCFKNFNVNLYVNYTSNKNAWMTSALFHDWLVNFHTSMKRQRRNVLLIMDNAPSHIIPKLSNVKIHVLPPTTTSHLQPLDSGIIQSFKKHYRKQQLTHLVDCIDRKEAPVLLLNTAIRFVKNAWDYVTPLTIINCWYHSGLVTRNDEASERQSLEVPDVELGNLLNTVQDDLGLDPELHLTVRQFVDMDKHLQPTEVIPENEIVKSVTETNDSDSDDERQETQLTPPPTFTEAKRAIETVIKFLEYQTSTVSSDIDKCVSIQNKINNIPQCSAKQKTMYDFLNM
ncbi:tigger transposable element-derived protein 6-like [Pecten maximus]|uniref:tigger transposable element-derived protein 6-like n=1 Tax=Pecten maximus TaxID=6579 RepID=UPI0014587EAA|nr:tigger transposable element-derived protein 6-like [Pecten maximus]